MTHKVVITSSAVDMTPAFEVLERIDAEVTLEDCLSEEATMEVCHNADAILSVLDKEPFNSRVIGKLERCKIIQKLGIGYDNVDLEAATAQGICVGYVPDYCLDEIPEHVLSLMLALERKILRQDKAVRAGQWWEVRRMLSPMGKLSEKTLGIVGFGRLGRRLATKAKALGMQVIAYDPYVGQEAFQAADVQGTSFDQLLSASDYISVHSSLTRENWHMFGAEQFQKMNPTAFFINTARGGLVDENALYEGLTQGCLAGAGLDVIEQEPPSTQNPLLRLENVVFTPHTAQYSDEAVAAAPRLAATDIVSVLSGSWPRYLLNPQVRELFISKWGKELGHQ